MQLAKAGRTDREGFWRSIDGMERGGELNMVATGADSAISGVPMTIDFRKSDRWINSRPIEKAAIV